MSDEARSPLIQVDAVSVSYPTPGGRPVPALREISLELRAGGYDGSTYELAYDRASDRLKGVYYQAVARQKYDVHFTRKQ